MTFESLADEKIIKKIIKAKHIYGLSYYDQELYLSKRFEASGKGVTNPDYKKISSAFNINYTEIKNHKNMRKKIKKIIKSKKAEFVNVFVNPNQKIIPKLQFGKPIEDLSPPLSRKEFAQNMIIEKVLGNKKTIEIN